jgi:uncharacterized protein
VVKVKVLEIDEKRKRIALTMRLADASKKPDQTSPDRGNLRHSTIKRPAPEFNNAMAAAFGKISK